MSTVCANSCLHKKVLTSLDDERFLERDVLPTNVTPRHYDLTIKPDLVNHIFEGSVRVL